MANQLEDEKWMRLALGQAHLAAQRGEVPIGAILVSEGVVLAHSHDRKEISSDPTAHAEINVLREAASNLGDWRLGFQESRGTKKISGVPNHPAVIDQQGRDDSLYFASRETVLYVTLEPCLMCLGAILQARVSRLVFGAKNLRWTLSDQQLEEIINSNQFNHRIKWISGVLEDECASILKSTFGKYRRNSK